MSYYTATGEPDGALCDASDLKAEFGLIETGFDDLYDDLPNLGLTYQKYADAYAAFKGKWSDLTGALTTPASVYHDGYYYHLLNNLADVTASEPGVTVDWEMLGQEALVYSGEFESVSYAEYDDIFSDDFDDYFIHVSTDLSNSVVYFQFISNGFSDGFERFHCNHCNSTNPSYSAAVGNAYINLTQGQTVNLFSEIFCRRPHSADAKKIVITRGVSLNSSANAFFSDAIASVASTSKMTGIRLQSPSGFSGSIKVYGFKEYV